MTCRRLCSLINYLWARFHVLWESAGITYLAMYVLCWELRLPREDLLGLICTLSFSIKWGLPPFCKWGLLLLIMICMTLFIDCIYFFRLWSIIDTQFRLIVLMRLSTFTNQLKLLVRCTLTLWEFKSESPLISASKHLVLGHNMPDRTIVESVLDRQIFYSHTVYFEVINYRNAFSCINWCTRVPSSRIRVHLVTAPRTLLRVQDHDCLWLLFANFVTCGTI